MSMALPTVELKDGLSDELRAEAPILPSDLPDEGHTRCGEVLGAVTVQDADHYGGTWGLRLVADFPVQAMGVVTVEDRLEEGTYALVRVDEEVEE